MARIPYLDPTVPPSAYKRALISFAVSKPGTWFYINVASRIDPVIVRATGGRVDSALGAAPIVLLTGRGAKTGLERTVPLLYFSDGDDVIVIASSFGRPKHPAWYRNLEVNPEATLYRRGLEGRYVAREVYGAERDRLYALAQQLYRGYGIYAERTDGIRTVPVMRLSAVN